MKKMTDQELADKIIELGVGKVYRAINGDAYEPPNPFRVLGADVRCYPAKQFVRDWRVAGAMMEKWSVNDLRELEIGIDEKGLHYCTCIHTPVKNWETASWSANESLPRAIIEACCEALNDYGEVYLTGELSYVGGPLILVKDSGDTDAAIASKEQYAEFELGWGHAFSNGAIMRYREVVGDISMIATFPHD